MNRCKNIHLFTCHSRKISSLLLAPSAIFCALFGLMITSSGAQAQEIPGGNITNAVISAVDIAKPAVVRIITNVPARLTVHFTAGDSITFPRNGGHYALDLSGSGAFISAHGDIVTADHVVHPPQADMTDYLYQIAAQDVTDYVNSTYAITPPYDPNQIYYALATGNFRSEPQYEAPKSQIYLSTAYTGPESAKTFKNVVKSNYAPIDIIKKESNPDLQDLAIIHIAMNDTPCITLGDSTAIAQQDELTVIGFPGNADITQRQDPTQLLTSSVNKIYVSAVKQSDNGTPLLEVAGNIEHGDSGGPALDSQGHLVGIVSFQKDSNGQPNNTSFLHVSQNIQQMVTALKLNTAPGTFQKEWQQGFEDYASTSTGHWHKANQEFKKLASNYPDFYAVQPFIAYTAQQAQHERLPDSESTSAAQPYLPYLLLAGFAILLLLALSATLFILNRKSRPAILAQLQANTTLEKGAATHTSSSQNAGWPSLPATPLPATIASWNQTPAIYDLQAQSTPAATNWNTSIVPFETGNSGSTRETKRDTWPGKPSIISIKEQATSWSKNTDTGTISTPPPASTPYYQNAPSQSRDEDITGKLPAILRERITKQASEGEKPIIKRALEPRTRPPEQVGNSNVTGEQGKKIVDTYTWPAPTTWQQAGMVNNDIKKRNSVKIRQIDPIDYKEPKQP